MAERLSGELSKGGISLPQERGSWRFSIKDAIKGGLVLGALGAFAGLSLIAAAAPYHSLGLEYFIVTPLVYGTAFGLLGFAGGGLVGGARESK